jgi:hypothetical protein
MPFVCFSRTLGVAHDFRVWATSVPLKTRQTGRWPKGGPNAFCMQGSHILLTFIGGPLGQGPQRGKHLMFSPLVGWPKPK